MTQDEVLVAYMNEHYAHARDHEHLLAHITSILSAASSVLIGLAVEQTVPAVVLGGVGLLVVLISALNWRVNRLHQNRAQAHMAVAGAIRQDFETRLWASGPSNAPSTFRQMFNKAKKGKLKDTWNMVPLLFGTAGAALVVWSVLRMF